VEAVIIEEPETWGPFGAKGFAELPAISSTAAVVAAIRDATGRELTRVPVRPEDIAGV
jgi:CO/xanthine dehydrogenase Mo-binding subunit